MMWKKLSFWILGLMLGLLVLMSGGWLTARAADLTSQASGVETPSTITEDGVTDSIDANADLMSGQGYVLTYDWGINDGQAIHAGDTVTVTLPKTASYSNFLSTPIDVQLQGSDKPAGSMLPNPDNSQQLIITFNDNLANTNTGRTGTIQIHVQGTKADGSGSGGGSSVDLIRKNGWPLKYDYDEHGYPTHIAWQITLNPDNKNLGDVTLTDQIGPHMTFHQAQQETDPYKITTNPILPAADFSATDSGSTLVMKLKNVTKKVDIFYYADIDPQYFMTHQQGNFSNAVGLVSTSGGGDATTDPGTPDGVPATQNIVKNYSWGASATIDGWYLGGFELTKSAADQTATKLAGATYTLQKKNSEGSYSDYQTGLITDGQGVLRDVSLEAGEYQLTETSAPDGYLRGTSSIQFTVSAKDTPTVHNLTQSDQPNGATLTKTNAKTKAAVPDATYRLVKGTAGGPDDTAVVKDNLVTDNKGQVTVSKLAPGTYYFEETHAPSGYQPNSEPVKVTITNEDTSVQTVSQSDQPTENSSSSNNSSSGSETPSSSSSSDASSSAPTADNSKTPSSSTTDDTQSGTEPDTSSTKTTSSSSTSTKTQHQVVANVGTSSSSSTLPYRHGAAAADNGASQSQRSSKPDTGVQRLLPKTNGQRSLIAMLIGFLILGLSVAGWRWHESRSTR
ncbi:hypothetical protein KB236_03180 [Levilactobacillus brevis]|nr:hypothetical protein KB236_03180 [Levilactobacillus brevis]